MLHACRAHVDLHHIGVVPVRTWVFSHRRNLWFTCQGRTRNRTRRLVRSRSVTSAGWLSRKKSVFWSKLCPGDGKLARIWRNGIRVQSQGRFEIVFHPSTNRLPLSLGRKVSCAGPGRRLGVVICLLLCQGVKRIRHHPLAKAG